MLRKNYFVALLMFLVTSLPSASQQPSSKADIDLSAPDGTRLKTTFFPAAKPGPAVILLHQCNRDRHAWEPLAKSLIDAGVSVLTMDNRGFGESGGKRYNTLTPQEERKMSEEIWPGDFDVAFHYLLSQSGVQQDKVAAGGASCGVNNAIQLARRHSQIKALVLLSGGTGRDGRMFLRDSKAVPVFTAAADDDVFGVISQIMQWYYSLSSNSESRFQRYTSGGHGAEMFAAHPELLSLIAHWFSATLKNDPQDVPSTNGSRIPEDLVRNSEMVDEPNGVARAREMLEQARKHDPKAQVFSEFIVNSLGYEHMVNEGDTKGAVQIFELNAAAYPEAPNVYDSLGDAYLADGQKEKARASAKKAIELLAGDTQDSEQRKKAIRDNAEKKLKD